MAKRKKQPTGDAARAAAASEVETVGHDLERGMEESAAGVTDNSTARDAAKGLEQRRHAFAGVRVVAAVRALLEWIEPSRALTDSGGLRRADIGQAAAFLGIQARGVAKLPARADEYRDDAPVVDGEVHVQSMRELRDLAAWWQALLASGLVEVTRSRARPGPAASAWLAEKTPPAEAADDLIGFYASNLLTDSLGRGLPYGTALARLSIARATATLERAGLDADRGPDQESWMRPAADRTLARLADGGLIAQAPTGHLRVPRPLRGTVARGVLLAMTCVAHETHDHGGDSAAHGSVPRIIRKSRMAAEVLSELRPLLADESVERDEDDPDSVNAALAHAAERHHLELFTPIGEERAVALRLHRLLTETLAEGRVDAARAVIDNIQPRPVGDLPSVAQIIGVGASALDTWHRDRQLTGTVLQAQVATWDAAAIPAARDVLRAANRGEAFDHITALTVRHGGRVLLTGIVLAVTGAVIEAAHQQQQDAREVAGRILAD